MYASLTLVTSRCFRLVSFQTLAAFAKPNNSNYSPTGNVNTIAGSAGGHRDGVGIEAQFRDMFGISTNGDEDLLVCDYQKNRKVTLQGE